MPDLHPRALPDGLAKMHQERALRWIPGQIAGPGVGIGIFRQLARVALGYWLRPASHQGHSRLCVLLSLFHQLLRHLILECTSCYQGGASDDETSSLRMATISHNTSSDQSASQKFHRHLPHVAGHVCVFGITHHMDVLLAACVKPVGMAVLVTAALVPNPGDLAHDGAPRLLRWPAVYASGEASDRGGRSHSTGNRLIADTSISSVSVGL